MNRILAFFLLLAVVAPAQAAAPNQDAQILHLLNRISFGPAPGDMDVVRRVGVQAYIEQQLHPETLLPPVALQERLGQMTITNASLAELMQRYQRPGEDGKLSLEEKEKYDKSLKNIDFELSETKILRATLSPAQLQEVMVDFWYNHFNVVFGKGLDRVLISTYERDAIRPYALGHFRDLLEATARHPAMLFYLDNWENTDPNSVLARKAMQRRGKELGINENYAREIMELHTLGVDGGYTQQDVTTLAHILTGWGLGRGDRTEKASFAFDSDRHDFGNKVFLGQTIHGGGADEIEHVLDILAQHPSTAHHIAYELAQYFVADDPPQSLVTALTNAFQQSSGDIAIVLRTLFSAPEFWDPKYEQVKFKPPFRYVVSALRGTAAVPQGDTRSLQGAIAGMGEPLYRCQTPNGYANTNDQWLNSDALLKRVSVAKGLARFSNENAEANIISSFGNKNWSATTLNAAQNVGGAAKPVVLLSSPEFLYY